MNDKGLEIARLRDRIERLERTVNAYESSLHTDFVDCLRKRLALVESVTYDLIGALGVKVIGRDDSITVLTQHGIPEYRARQILMLINNKFAQPK